MPKLIDAEALIGYIDERMALPSSTEADHAMDIMMAGVRRHINSQPDASEPLLARIKELEASQPSEDSRGWQEQDSKGDESATFNQEQEADGVECVLREIEETIQDRIEEHYRSLTRHHGQEPEPFIKAEIKAMQRMRGIVLKKIKARRQAVEAARGMG